MREKHPYDCARLHSVTGAMAFVKTIAADEFRD